MLKYLKNVSTLKIDESKCVGCGTCVSVCPHDVLEVRDEVSKVKDIDLCMECGACMMNCPTQSIDVKTGVGCAAGILNGLLKGTEPTCDCGSDGKKGCC